MVSKEIFGTSRFLRVTGLLAGLLCVSAAWAQVGADGRPSAGVVDFSSTVISNRVRALAPQEVPPTPASPVASPRQAAETVDRLEFQDFVLQSTGRELNVFGSELFRNVPSTFAPLDNVPVTPDYLIGPGDEILIRAWGQIDVDYSAVVDRTGAISIPKVGTFVVSGIKYQDLAAFLKTSFGRIFRNFELTASLGRLRSIQIFVVGQAKRPGTYTVSSLSTLVTALFAAGGPSTKGSLRSIQLKRGNRVVSDIDLYDLLVSGDKSRDAQLLPGDVIYIPPVGPLVALAGSVNVPAIYEIKGRASLSELLQWAGGLSTTAQGQKVTVERIEDRKARKVEEFSLADAGLARQVRDGDLVSVTSLSPRFDSTVTLRGNVANPGRFPWRQGMRVRDLIPEREALISRDYWIARNLVVGVEGNVARLLSLQQDAGTKLGVIDLLQRRDTDNSASTIAEAVRRRQIEGDAARLGGATQAPSGSNPSRLSNQIKPTLNEVNWDYAVIERISPENLSNSLIPFNLGKAVLEGDAQQNLILQPGDIISIFSKEDVQVSTAKQTKFIRLEGELNAAGIYQAMPGETLRQLVSRTGGIAPGAYLFGAVFTRESARVQQQKTLDESLNRLERELQRVAVTRAQNAAETTDGANRIKLQFEQEQRMIERLRGIRATGRVVLELSSDGKARDLPDVPLEDGDRFIVPTLPSVVGVSGSVFNENVFLYQPGKRLGDYLSQAGGPTKDADVSSIYLLRADGTVFSGRQSGWFQLGGIDNARIQPGDSIIVPEELNKTGLMTNLKDIAQVFYQFGLGAAAIKVLRN